MFDGYSYTCKNRGTLCAEDLLKCAGGLFLVGSLRGGRKVRISIPLPGGTLDPRNIPKFEMPLLVPPAMPSLGEINLSGGGKADYYEIAVRQFVQQILPSPLPATTVWGYGRPAVPGSFSYPSFTIEAIQSKPVRVKWINGLMDASGNYLPHILPVDQTLHWSNPPGPRDTPGFSQQRYTARCRSSRTYTAHTQAMRAMAIPRRGFSRTPTTSRADSSRPEVSTTSSGPRLRDCSGRIGIREPPSTNTATTGFACLLGGMDWWGEKDA